MVHCGYMLTLILYLSNLKAQVHLPGHKDLLYQVLPTWANRPMGLQVLWLYFRLLGREDAQQEEGNPYTYKTIETGEKTQKKKDNWICKSQI